jgi:ferrous iron transport protein A
MTNEVFTLDKLKINSEAVVEQVKCEGNILRRFLDLGLISGTKITALYASPSGDPTAYFFRGTVIALRKDDAKKIEIVC